VLPSDTDSCSLSDVTTTRPPEPLPIWTEWIHPLSESATPLKFPALREPAVPHVPELAAYMRWYWLLLCPHNANASPLSLIANHALGTEEEYA